MQEKTNLVEKRGKEAIGTYCRHAGKFERGQLFRRYCIRCVHNTAHLGDDKLCCRYLEYRGMPDSKPSIRIPRDMRG